MQTPGHFGAALPALLEQADGEACLAACTIVNLILWFQQRQLLWVGVSSRSILLPVRCHSQAQVWGMVPAPFLTSKQCHGTHAYHVLLMAGPQNLHHSGSVGFGHVLLCLTRHSAQLCVTVVVTAESCVQQCVGVVEDPVLVC
jgi:hypothetical protein